MPPGNLLIMERPLVTDNFLTYLQWQLKPMTFRRSVKDSKQSVAMPPGDLLIMDQPLVTDNFLTYLQCQLKTMTFRSGKQLKVKVKVFGLGSCIHRSAHTTFLP